MVVLIRNAWNLILLGGNATNVKQLSHSMQEIRMEIVSIIVRIVAQKLLNVRSYKMDKQKQINEIADIIFEALNNKGRIANGEGVDIISGALYKAGYRKIDKNAVVLTRGDYEKLLDVRADVILKDIDKVFKEEFEDTKRSMEKKIKPIYKAIETRTRKETADKFARLVEFHSVATIDENGIEQFIISALGLKEILHEEFGVLYDEIYKEITDEN